MIRRFSASLIRNLSKKSINTHAPVIFITQKRCYAKQKTKEGPSMAIILSGCGYLDGSEITEAVSCIIATTKNKYRPIFFAPDGKAEEVFDHVTKKIEKNEIREIIAESTRIARQRVQRLNMLRESNFDALVFPGGFGAAKILSTYAKNPMDYTVHPEVERIVKEFNDAGKPIGFCCIAPVIAAKVLGKTKQPKLTIGKDEETAKHIENQGAIHVVTEKDEVCIDDNNLIFSTPAFMDPKADFYSVYVGIEKMIDSMIKMVGQTKGDERVLRVVDKFADTFFGKKEVEDKSQRWAHLKKKKE